MKKLVLNAVLVLILTKLENVLLLIHNVNSTMKLLNNVNLVILDILLILILIV